MLEVAWQEVPSTQCQLSCRMVRVLSEVLIGTPTTCGQHPSTSTVMVYIQRLVGVHRMSAGVHNLGPVVLGSCIGI